MFGNNDFNKKRDPLVDAVTKVMQENQLRRDIEKQFQEEIGIQAKRELPFQQHADYDRVLSERTAVALNEGSMKKEELVGNQHKIDANKNNKVDAQDFKILKAQKKQPQGADYAAQRRKERVASNGRMDEDDLDKFEPDDYKPSKKKQKVSLYRHKTSGKEIASVKHPGDSYELVNEAEYPPGAGQDTAKDKDPDMMKGRPGEKDETPRAVPMPPKRPANMEEEALNELSKGTLGSYVKKASHDVATKSAATGRYAERANKEEDDRKKTGDYSGYRQGRKDNETADKMFGKSWKRRQGIAKAVDKLTKEETINEISDKVKAAYARKADKEVTRTNTMGVAKRTGGVGIEDAKRKMDNRKAGIKRSMSEDDTHDIEIGGQKVKAAGKESDKPMDYNPITHDGPGKPKSGYEGIDTHTYDPETKSVKANPNYSGTKDSGSSTPSAPAGGRQGNTVDNQAKQPTPGSKEDEADDKAMVDAAEKMYQQNRAHIKAGNDHLVKTDLGTDANGNKKYLSPIYPVKPDGTSSGPGKGHGNAGPVISQKKFDSMVKESAPPGDKYERMIKHIKKKYSKDGLTDKEKSIAYATAWKAKGKESK